MSQTASPAPYPVRFRLAITGLTIAWILAGLFFVLGVRANAQSSSTASSAASVAETRPR